MPTADDFRRELHRMMYEAFNAGHNFIDVNAGQLHARLGDYPGPNHRMPNCCQVMKAAIAEDAGDEIREQPASGQGASLTIRYILPRPA
jgi:5-methylcytosine-specific restriction protein A